MTDPPDRRLRILLVTKGLDIGGLERMVVALASSLRRRGHSVEVALVNDQRRQLLPELEAADVRVHELGGSDRIGWKAAVGLARLLRSGQYDVVHVHGPLPAVVCRLVPGAAPIVTTAHTPLVALRRTTRAAWRLTTRRDAASIVVSAAVGRSTDLSSTVIPHGVDAVAAAAAGSTRATPGPDSTDGTDSTDGRVIAICVASHRRAKNYPNLLRALAIVKTSSVPIRLVAIGDGPDLETHRRLARDLGVSDMVSFEMPTPDVLGRIAAADLLVVASDWEGQPMVIAEALAVGTPVVSTAVGQAELLVQRDAGRVVAPGDHVALADAITELAGDSALRSAMRRAALERGSKWTLDDAVAAHLEIYSGVSSEGTKLGAIREGTRRTSARTRRWSSMSIHRRCRSWRTPETN